VDAVGRQRAAVQLTQPGQQPCLLVGIEERDPLRLLVRADLANQLEPPVDELEDLRVGRRGLIAKPLKLGVRHSSSTSLRAGYEPNTCSRRVRSRISRRASLTIGSSGWPASTASNR